MAPALEKTASIIGLLSFGTVTSVFSKLVYELQSTGLDGEPEYFTKPWAMTTLMFIGMSFCLPLAFLEQHLSRKRALASEAAQPLLADGNGHDTQTKRSELKEALFLIAPTSLDLAATVLMNVGLLTVTASVYQMMRGAEMLFAAAMSVTFLRRRLNKYHLGGIACCVLGITLVGMSSLLSGQGSASRSVSQFQILIGMALIILSQAVQAAQITFEDYFMSEMSIAPMKIVGYEGIFGAFIMLCIMAPIVRVLPGKDGDGIHEDIFDTWHMITHNSTLAAILCVQGCALLAYNYAGMHVTGQMGAVFRTVLETMRTLFVWLVDLVLFYANTGLGEAWSRYSLVQAAGFAVMVTGTLIYSRGEEEEARRAVDEYVASGAASAEAAALEAQQPLSAGLLPPPADAGSAEPVAIRSRPTAIPVMMASPMHASYSMAAGSYREAVASSLRSRGLAGPASHL